MEENHLRRSEWRDLFLVPPQPLVPQTIHQTNPFPTQYMHIEVLDLVVWLVNCWPTVFGMKSYSSYSCSREEAKEGNGLTKFNCFFFFFLRQSLHRSCLSLKSQNLSTGTQSSLHHLRPINVQTLRTFAVSAQPPYH